MHFYAAGLVTLVTPVSVQGLKQRNNEVRMTDCTVRPEPDPDDDRTGVCGCEARPENGTRRPQVDENQIRRITLLLWRLFSETKSED